MMFSSDNFVLYKPKSVVNVTDKLKIEVEID